MVPFGVRARALARSLEGQSKDVAAGPSADAQKRFYPPRRRRDSGSSIETAAVTAVVVAATDLGTAL